MLNPTIHPLSHHGLTSLIRYRLSKEQLSIEELAKRTRTPKPQIQAMYEGRALYSVSFVAAVAAVLNADLTGLWAQYQVWLYKAQSKNSGLKIAATATAAPASRNDLRQLAQQVITQNPYLPAGALIEHIQHLGLSEQDARNAVAQTREERNGEYAYAG